MNNNEDLNLYENIEYSTVSIYLSEMILVEDNRASMIQTEINQITDEINHLLNVQKEETKKKDKSFDFFSPKSYTDTELLDKKYEELVYKFDEEKKEKEKEYKILMEKIYKLNCIKYFIDYHCDYDCTSAKFDSGLGKQILEAQEIVKSRIARDLHDSTIQSLTNLLHRSELCTKLLDVDLIRVRLEIISMTSNLRTIINDMRNIIYDLRPMSLKDLGLGVTIKRFLDDLNKNNNIQTELIIVPHEKEISEILNITLFRIVQEACNNTIKHADANKILVELKYEEESVQLIVSDDGKGFELDGKKNAINLKSGYGLGLSIMSERAMLLSGDFSVESKIGKGTSIIINLPFDDDMEDEYGYD